MLCLSGFELYSRWVPLSIGRSKFSAKLFIVFASMVDEIRGYTVYVHGKVLPKLKRIQARAINVQC